MKQQLSDYIQGVLDANNFEVLHVLRYGPRFACLMVHAGEQEAMFKIVLPENELPPLQSVQELSDRLVKEATFLQYFSTQITDEQIFIPNVFTFSDARPAWSLRQYIDGRSFSLDGSTFRFKESFFETISPERIIKFFETLHHLSETLPQNLSDQIRQHSSTLIDPARIKGVQTIVDEDERLAPFAVQIGDFLTSHEDDFRQYNRVLVHYEPYSPHFFLVEDQLGLIDWENVGWGHRMQDLSVVWMRAFEHPEWQNEYLSVLEKNGHFADGGRLLWDSELLLQSIANLMHFSRSKEEPTEFRDKASAFFLKTIQDVTVRYAG